MATDVKPTNAQVEIAQANRELRMGATKQDQDMERKMMGNLTVGEMKDRILARAVEDGDFRAELVEDPNAVISGELGVFIPENFVIQVHEDSATTTHVVLPLSDQLTEEDMAKIAGGGVEVNWDTVNVS